MERENFERRRGQRRGEKEGGGAGRKEEEEEEEEDKDEAIVDACPVCWPRERAPRLSEHGGEGG